MVNILAARGFQLSKGVFYSILIGIAVLVLGSICVNGLQIGGDSSSGSTTTYRSGNTFGGSTTRDSGTRVYSPSPTPRPEADTTGFSDLQVWRFCTAFFKSELQDSQFRIVSSLEEDALLKDNAKRVHKLVKKAVRAYPKVDAGLMRQTMEACEKWRDDDWAEYQRSQ